MQPSDVYEAGKKTLLGLWESTIKGEAPPPLPGHVAAAITEVMSPSAQVSQRYALPTQVLLKLVVGDEDGRRLSGFGGVDGPFSARSFARETLVALKPVGARLGNSDDPYVSNPLRQERLQDKLLTGRGGPGWKALFGVLEYVDKHPDDARAVLLRALSHIKDWEEHAKPQPHAASPKPTDL